MHTLLRCGQSRRSALMGEVRIGMHARGDPLLLVPRAEDDVDARRIDTEVKGACERNTRDRGGDSMLLLVDDVTGAEVGKEVNACWGSLSHLEMEIYEKKRKSSDDLKTNCLP